MENAADPSAPAAQAAGGVNTTVPATCEGGEVSKVAVSRVRAFYDAGCQLSTGGKDGDEEYDDNEERSQSASHKNFLSWPCGNEATAARVIRAADPQL